MLSGAVNVNIAQSAGSAAATGAEGIDTAQGACVCCVWQIKRCGEIALQPAEVEHADRSCDLAVALRDQSTAALSFPSVLRWL